MNTQSNEDAKNIWGSDSSFNILDIFDSCMGYSRTPAWSQIYREIKTNFRNFNGLRTIELGCGQGKVSILFALLKAKTTLLDYSSKQLQLAKCAADNFGLNPILIEGNLLDLSDTLFQRFDIAMSFGVAEHFFGADRQKVFDAHSKVLRKGGIAIIWAPNLYGLLYRSGVGLRKLLHRPICLVEETPFSRTELRRRAQKAGLSDLKIFGGGLLRTDFSRFIININRLLNSKKNIKSVPNSNMRKRQLLHSITQNHSHLMLWNNLFSYPLVLIGRR